MTRYGGRRSNAGRAPRWLALKYAADCKVCGRAIPAGETAFYDYSARTATCHYLGCAKEDGLTRSEWSGSPLSGAWVDVIVADRIGPGAPDNTPVRSVVTRFNSGATSYRNARGRCEDAPCCGCCS